MSVLLLPSLRLYDESQQTWSEWGECRQKLRMDINSLFFKVQLMFSKNLNEKKEKPTLNELSLLPSLFFLPPFAAHGILVPGSSMEPVPPAVEAWSFNHWTAREVPSCHCFKIRFHTWNQSFGFSWKAKSPVALDLVPKWPHGLVSVPVGVHPPLSLRPLASPMLSLQLLMTSIRN